jgi:hypothetical protein
VIFVLIITSRFVNTYGLSRPNFRLVGNALAKVPTRDQAKAFSTIDRRAAISTAGAFLGILSQPLFAPATEPEGGSGLSSKAISERLSKVPFYSITTSDGEVPYFTKQAKNGAPVSVFFAQRSDAEALLPQVRKVTDPDAVVTPVSLDTCWELVSNPDEKSNGGLFVLQANKRQYLHANANLGKDLKFDAENKIPLFYDRRVVLGKTQASPEGTFPFFFKLEDLENVYKQGLASMPDEAARNAAGRLNVEVTTLDSTIDTMRQGSVANYNGILLVSSEAFSAEKS